jgi:hypothetical protein
VYLCLHIKDARKRYKYLAHLPLSCDVIFAEIDWHAPVGVNICRQLVTRSTAVSPLASPSTFTTLHPQSSPYTTSAVANNNNNKSPLPLVSADSLRRFEPELKARAKRRSTKLRKEEKEQARFRRNSLSAGTAASLSAAGGPTQPVAPPLSLQDYPSQSVNEQRQRSSADQIFDFDDERLWAPLPVSLSSAVSPPTQQQSNPSISTNSSAWHNQQLAPGQLSIERQFPTLATATSALASATKPSAPAASSPSPVSFAQALATRRDQELLIFGSPVSLPVNNISTSVPAAHQSSTATTAAANIVDGQLVVDEEPPSGKRSKSRRSKQIMLMRSSAGGRRAY